MSNSETRIKWHAGLLGSSDSCSPSVSECTWIPNGKIKYAAKAVDDLLCALNVLNRELNGVSSNGNCSSCDSIPRIVVYSINEVIRMLRKARTECIAEDDRRLLIDAEMRLWLGWNAVISGDIDDIVNHVNEEFYFQSESKPPESRS